MASTKKAHGEYREKVGDSITVWVTNGTIGTDISEAEYRAQGFEPTIEALPWKHEREENR